MANLDRDKLFPWLTLMRAKFMGSGRARMLVERFGTLEKALQASVDELASVRGFNMEMAQSVKEAAAGKYDQAVEKELHWVRREGVQILLYTDPGFPDPLRHIPSPPALLYVKGSILPQDILSIAIVGSRRATDGGCRMANKIAYELAEAGLTVNSGLAWGIDAAAHKGALRCKTGRTLAVLGNGLKFVYPKEFVSLYDQVSKRGALVTELFHDVSPDARNFPPRNRIISGLSLGTLIVEAPAKSGALITARYALDQGKEIFALPGALDNESAEGNNNLIRDSGAILVTSAADILRELEDKIVYYRNELSGNINRMPAAIPSVSTKGNTPLFDAISERRPPSKPQTQTEPETPPAPKPEPTKPPELSEDEGVVMSSLTYDPRHIDQICRELQWPIARVSSALGLLELRGLVEREAGMRFRIL